MSHARRTAASLPLLAATLVTACGDSPVAAVADAPATLASAHATPGMAATSVHRVALSPLNESGVRGTATLTVRGDQLTVVLNAHGHEVGELHPQHLHGFEPGVDATCPAAGFDGGDGDGVLTVAEGLPFYGPVQLPLLQFPTPVNQGGAISYKASFPLAGLPFTAEDLHQKAMVLHGATVAGGYVTSLPVACGTVEPVG